MPCYCILFNYNQTLEIIFQFIFLLHHQISKKYFLEIYFLQNLLKKYFPEIYFLYNLLLKKILSAK